MNSLERLRSIQVADVYKAGRKAAKLIRTAHGTEFTYLHDYLDDGIAVATTLPLTSVARHTVAGSVPPFFAGLLPEGRRLFGLQRIVKTSADDEFSILLAVGRDPIGDVQVVPEGDQPGEIEPLVVVEESFDEVRFSELLSDTGVFDKVAIPGVQDKVSAGMISVPVAAAGHRYILKIDSPEYPHVVANEFYFINVARSAGVPVVNAQLVHDAVGCDGLLIQRFDRVSDANGAAIALASEDACQLLDRWPGDKYNVTTEQVAHAIVNVCEAGVVAARDVFRQICFAWLSGNGDVHAKNISVISDLSGERKVAPAYDLPSTLFYRDLSLALSIGGKTTGLSRRGLLDFAASIGLNEKAGSRILNGILDATASLTRDLRERVLPFDQNTVSGAVRELEYRRRQLAK